MATAELATRGPDIEAIEQVLVNGDLARLSPAERVSYYNRVCQSLGLNPLTKPFDYISLNGKLVLYAKRDATEQLRSNRGVSVVIIAREITEDCYVVTARASLPTGRQDESIGAVNIAGLKGENRANAMMKAETKAKRRVTLSICGLGLLDETEVETVPAYSVEAPVAASAILPAPTKDASAPKAGEIGHTISAERAQREGPSTDGLGHVTPQLPPGAVLITKVDSGTGKAKGFLYHSGQGAAPRNGFAIYDDRIKAQAEQFCQDARPAIVTFKESAGGKTYVIGITDPQTGEDHDEDDPILTDMLKDSDIPF